MPDNAGWKIYPGVPQKGVVDPRRDVPFYPDTDDSEEGSTGWLKGLFLRLELRIGEITDAIKGLQKSVDKRVAAPVWYRIAQSVVIPASGVGVIRLAGPDQGHYWHVRGISVGGLTPITTAAGRADVYVSAADLRSSANLATLGLADWRDQATTLPNIASFASEELPLRLNEELYIVITNGTVGQQYVACAQVTDYEEAALRQEFAV